MSIYKLQYYVSKKSAKDLRKNGSLIKNFKLKNDVFRSFKT